MSARVVWMIGAAVLSVPTTVIAKGPTSELVESADLNLMAAAGRERLDERLKASVSAACKHHSANPVAQFQPGPSGKGNFMTVRGKAPREICWHDMESSVHRFRDQLIERSVLQAEAKVTAGRHASETASGSDHNY